MLSWLWPRVLAHRCGGALAPENTLAGLEIVARLGGAGVEFDVMLSADGVPVLCHDETLARTTGAPGRVCDTVASRLLQLDAGSLHHPAFAGEALPSLAQALAACQRLGLAANIELKPAAGFETATGRAVAALTRQLWHVSPAPLLSSFCEAALVAARETTPELPRALLIDRPGGDAVMRSLALGARAVHCNTRHADAALVAELAAAGVALAVYTENDPARAQALWALGVASVITDRPDRVGAPVCTPAG